MKLPTSRQEYNTIPTIVYKSQESWKGHKQREFLSGFLERSWDGMALHTGAIPPRVCEQGIKCNALQQQSHGEILADWERSQPSTLYSCVAISRSDSGT